MSGCLTPTTWVTKSHHASSPPSWIGIIAWVTRWVPDMASCVPWMTFRLSLWKRECSSVDYRWSLALWVVMSWYKYWATDHLFLTFLYTTHLRGQPRSLSWCYCISLCRPLLLNLCLLVCLQIWLHFMHPKKPCNMLLLLWLLLRIYYSLQEVVLLHSPRPAATSFSSSSLEKDYEYVSPS